MKIRVGGFFSGIGAHHSAIERISHYRDVEFEVVFQCEWDEKTALAYDTIHGKTLNLGDVTKVNDIGGDLAVDILYWTPPCQDISLAGKLAGNSVVVDCYVHITDAIINDMENPRTDTLDRWLE